MDVNSLQARYARYVATRKEYGFTVLPFERWAAVASPDAYRVPSPACPHGKGFHCKTCWPKGGA